jgi:hypothetical protein
VLIIDQTYWHFALYSLWAMGIVLIFLGVTWERLRHFVFIGLLLPGLATAIIMPKVIKSQMDVYIATEKDGEISVFESLGVASSRYRFSSGEIVTLPKPGSKIRAVIVNQTSRKIYLVRLENSRTKWQKSPLDKMVLTVSSDGIAGIPSRVDFTGPETLIVKTLKGREIFDDRHWLTWD